MMREPMDEGEIALDYQSRHNADALAAWQSKTGDSPAESLEFCEWCDERIPEPRRLARRGCTLCVNCQSAKERLASMEVR